MPQGVSKILGRRGQVPLSVLYPLAHLGAAHAAALAGDMPKGRTAYRDFFRMWKSADPDLPVLVEARRNYQRAIQASTQPKLRNSQ